MTAVYTLLLTAIVSTPVEPLYVMVHPPSLRETAVEWASYRDEAGWQVRLLEVSADLSAETLREGIHALIPPDRRPTAAVLLLGDVIPGGIPTFYVDQDDPQLRSLEAPNFATDQPFETPVGGALSASVALGRVPVATNDEARAVLAKIRRYESEASAGPWRTRVTYLASEARFGAYDLLLERMFRTLVTTILPPRCDFTMTYASASSVYCPPPSELGRVALQRLGEPAIMFNYLGHGFAQGLDRMRWRDTKTPILGVGDIAALSQPKADLPIAFLGCCSTGWYDLAEGKRSLAEEMLLAPGGPIAVIAGSRITHPYATAILQKDLTRLLLEDQVRSVGELDALAMRSMIQIDADDRTIDALMKPVARLAKWPTGTDELRVMHTKLYNLIGDPGTRIAPAPSDLDLALHSNILTGRTALPFRGRVEILVETARDSQIAAASLRTPVGRDDPDLEAKAKVNVDLVNDRVLKRIETSVEDGQFAVTLGELPVAARLVRVWAHGADKSGAPVAASGALRLVPPAATGR